MLFDVSLWEVGTDDGIIGATSFVVVREREELFIQRVVYFLLRNKFTTFAVEIEPFNFKVWTIDFMVKTE